LHPVYIYFQFSIVRLTSIRKGPDTILYRYDRFGQLLQDGDLLYRHDTNGNPVEVEYPQGVKAQLTYDGLDRPQTLTLQTPSGAQPVVTAATYLPGGPFSSLTLGNGLTEQRPYTSRYFPEEIQLGSHLHWRYTTDAVGNIEQIQDILDPAKNGSPQLPVGKGGAS
jgi:YD repeat-containing protein